MNTFSILLGFCRSRFCCFACYFIEFVFENKWKKRRRNENSLLYSILLFNTQYVYFYIVRTTTYTYKFFHFVYFVKCTQCSVEFVRHHHARSRARNNDRKQFFCFFFCLFPLSDRLFMLPLILSLLLIKQIKNNNTPLLLHTIDKLSTHNHKCILKLIVHKPYWMVEPICPLRSNGSTLCLSIRCSLHSCVPAHTHWLAKKIAFKINSVTSSIYLA